MPTPLATLIPEVNAFVAGVPDDTVIIMLRRGAQQFSRDTRVWKRRLGTAAFTPPATGFEATVAVPSTDYPLPDETRIIAIEQLYFRQEGMAERTVSRGGVERPYRYDEEDEVLTINPGVLRQAVQLTVEASLEPTDSATSIGVKLARWSSALRDYALFLLRSMPDEKWTSAQRVATTRANRLRHQGRRVPPSTSPSAAPGARLEFPTIPFHERLYGCCGARAYSEADSRVRARARSRRIRRSRPRGAGSCAMSLRRSPGP